MAKFNSSTTQLLASTYLGGTLSDFGRDIILDSSNNIYIVGYAASTNFPTTTGAYQVSNGGGSWDVIIAELNSNFTQLLGSTYLGGTNSDAGYGLVLDYSSNIYIAGYTASTNFSTTTGAYQGNLGNAAGTNDIFISKFGNPVPTITSLSPATTTSAGTADQTLTVVGTGYNVSSTVKLSDVSLVTTYVSTTQITAVVPLASLINGSYDVTVNNVQPGGGNSVSSTLTIQNPVATVTSLSPSLVYNDNGAFTLTVNGTGFNTSSVVNYAGSAKTTTYVSSTQITASILSTDLGTDGRSVKAVTVTNGSPGGGTSASSNFTVVLRVGSSASASAVPTASADTSASVSVPAPVVITPAVTPTNIIEPLITTPAPATTPAAVSYVFKKNLRSGMNNSDVKKLQVFLNTHGFKVAAKGAGSPGKETTYFGAATRAAIMKFQKANKIKPVNGLLGPLTRGKVNKM